MTPDSPTRRIGGAPLASFPEVRHHARLLSLESVTDPEAVRRFDARMRAALGRPPRYVLEPKFDGLSLEVVYRDGVLERASTRGDGDRGEDVTANVRTIRSVPRRLRGAAPPRLLAVRGEAIMHGGDFRALNARLERDGEEPFANPRNAAAGSVRQLDPRVTAQRRLDVVFYDVIGMVGGRRLPDDLGELRQLTVWGLRTSSHARLAATLDDVWRYHRRMERRRDALGYEIDGIVLKLNDLASRARLRSTSRHPRWALAFKFTPRQAETTLEDIVVQVGRTGALTPVAVLAPVPIGGVIVSRATLHNRGVIARADLRIGDAVRVVRAGDVIPDIVERVARRGARRRRRFRMPAACPACGTRTVRDGPFDRCPNGLACPAQLKRAIAHFGSRSALDIPGLGAETVDALVSAGLVRSVADLFALRAADLAALRRFGRISAANLVAAIARARRTTLWRFLNALGIPGVGAETARRLAAHFGSLRAIRGASESAIRRTPGAGPAVAAHVAAFLRQRENARVIDGCLRRGLVVTGGGAPARGSLAGRVVVFTGGLSGMTREQAEERVRAAGGRTATSVGPRTNLVVAGDEPGSKFDRARRLGVRVVDERAFRRLLGAA